MSDQVKCLGHIHQACVHLRSIPQEVADCFDGSPCAHGGGSPWLIGKLELISTKRFTKKQTYNPVQYLQNET